MKILPLGQIQAKIVEVHNRKPGIFYDRVRRLMNLRKDEFNSIDLLLLETNAEYKQIAADSLLCASHFEWRMKVNGTRPDSESSDAVAGLRGFIDENGLMRCTTYRRMKVSSNTDPVCFVGTIDHLGTVFMKVIQWESPDLYRAPEWFDARTGTEGQVSFKKR